MGRQRLWALPVLCLVLASQGFAAGDLAAGRTKVQTCAVCHGPDGNSINPEWPSLAGQGAPYILEQLQRFKSGARQHALMTPQAAALLEQDMLDVAAFYAAQIARVGMAQADEDLLKHGELIYRAGIYDREVPACMGCHGPDGSGNPPAKFPRLAGQQAAYTVLQLTSFRDGAEPYKTYTRQNQMMNTIAGKLTDRDIEAVAQYLTGLY